MPRNPKADALADEEMLSMDPPPLATRLIAWLIFAVFAVFVAVAVFVPIPETIRCRFVLVSEAGTDPIQARLLSVLQKVSVEEGQQVSAGEELFQLRSDEIRSWRTLQRNYEEDLRALLERVPKAEKSHEESVTIQQSVLAQAERELEFSRMRLANKQDLTGRMKELAEGGIISTVDLKSYELDLEQSQKELEVGGKIKEQAILALGRLETDRSRVRTEEQAEKMKLETRIQALNKQLSNCQDDIMQIVAPYDAVVISLAHRNAGSVVDEGQELCQLARLEGQPRARLHLNEDGLPRLESGQDVQFFFDAFPYQRYGTVDGELNWISPAAAATPEGPRFTGYAGLDRLKLNVGGIDKPLRVGMKGEARIRTGRRTLLEFAFEPLRQVRENLGR